MFTFTAFYVLHSSIVVDDVSQSAKNGYWIWIGLDYEEDMDG
jgi:hypothetical protein